MPGKCARFLSLVVISSLFITSQAWADLFSFRPIEPVNSGTIAYDLALQLALDISPQDDGVLFTFFNDGPSGEASDVDSPIDSTIARVYFDFDGVSLSFDNFVYSNAGVLFEEDTSPSNLPGGNNLDPTFVATFSSGAQPPPAHNGVDPGENLGLLFSGDLGDVLSAINTGDLRIGIHVISIGSGESSDAFILTTNVTPLPGAVLLCALGLGVTGVALRRFA